jgi:hypothetical protein
VGGRDSNPSNSVAESPSSAGPHIRDYPPVLPGLPSPSPHVRGGHLGCVSAEQEHGNGGGGEVEGVSLFSSLH